MVTVSTGYVPRKAFIPFHMRRHRWSSLVCHRRAGKTVACIADLTDAALRCRRPNPRFAYVAPYYTQAKDVAWTYLKQMVSQIPGVSINESELRCDLPNGGRVRLYGAENYDRMRGIYLDGVVMDEPADMDPRAWPEVIRPALSDREGWGVFIGTPKGRNAFFDIHSRAESLPDEWFTMVLRADQSGLLAPGELIDAQATLTPEQYAQEYLCSFDAAILGAYFGKEMSDAQDAGRITDVPWDETQPVHTAWDLGIGDSTAIWFWQAVGQELHVIDHYEAHGYGLDHYAAVLASKPYRYEHDWVPHDARARELGTGRSRIETMHGLKLRPRLVPDAKVMDRINALRVLMPRVWFDADKCKFGLEALRQYRTEFDEKTKAFRDTPKHDWTSHTADAATYMALAYREMKRDPPKPAPVVPKGIRDMTFDQLIASTRKRGRERI